MEINNSNEDCFGNHKILQQWPPINVYYAYLLSLDHNRIHYLVKFQWMAPAINCLMLCNGCQCLLVSEPIKFARMRARTCVQNLQ